MGPSTTYAFQPAWCSGLASTEAMSESCSNSRRIQYTGALLFLSLAFCACSSTHTTRLLYSAGGQKAVFAYRIENDSGAATPVLGSPFLAGIAPSSVVVHPAKRFA